MRSRSDALVALTPLALVLFVVIANRASRTDALERENPTAEALGRLVDAVVATEALIMLGVAAAIPLVTPAADSLAAGDDPALGAMRALTGGLLVVFLGGLLVARGVLHARRWLVQTGLLLLFPLLPTGGLLWLGLRHLAAQPLLSPLTGVPEPHPAALVLTTWLLVGPVALAPAALRVWRSVEPAGERRSPTAENDHEPSPAPASPGA